MTNKINGIFLATLASTVVGCSDVGNSSFGSVPFGPGGFDANSPLIVNAVNDSNLLTDNQFSVFESLGLQVNLGDNPPNIEGTFRIDPRIIQASTVPGSAEDVGTTISSVSVTFSNQNSATQTLEVVVVEDDAEGAGSVETVIVGSSILGSDNAFTAFFVSEITFNNQAFALATGFSGIITEAGIENFQLADVVIDDGGDPFNDLIPNNTGELFIDETGFSELIPDTTVLASDLAPNTNALSRLVKGGVDVN